MLWALFRFWSRAYGFSVSPTQMAGVGPTVPPVIDPAAVVHAMSSPAVTARVAPARALRLAALAGTLVAIAHPGLAPRALAQPQAGDAPPSAPEKSASGLEAFQGRTIRLISFVTPVDGPAGSAWAPLEEDLVSLSRNQLRLREGAPFDPALISDDLSRLNRLGRFRSVEAQAQALADGSVELIYVVTLQPLITAVQTIGNTIISDQDLNKTIDVLVGTAVDTTQLERAARRIEAMYRERGYYNARVTFDEQELSESGVVLMRVREGEPTKITRIRFVGNSSITASELRNAIKTDESWLLDIIKLKGQLDLEQLGDDVATVIKYYRDRGYIDVRCSTQLTPSLDGREALVDFIVEEGPLYTLRNVRVGFDEGDSEVFTSAQLVGLMAMKPGDAFSESALRESLKAIEAAYGLLGYADVRVGNRAQRAGDGVPEVDLLIQVSEGQRFRTGMISIVGNTITRDRVIRRQLTLQPGRPLDATAAKESEQRVTNTRLFAQGSVKVALQPEDPQNAPGERDVVVEVAETNTGSFNLGASVGSDGGVAGIVSLSQRNFDITDTPDSFGELFSADSFRGGGQTLSLLLSPGDRVRNFELGLSDPALNDSEYSGSARVFYRQRIYGAYDEDRYGARFSVGRKFGSLWSVNIPVKIENVEISDIDADAPTEYFEESDSNLINSVGVSFTRSSLDRLAFPTKGTRIEFGIDQYGFLGDDAFTRLNAEWSRYFLLEQDVLGRSTTLQFTTRANYILGDENVAPFYERNYLGGQNMRGFAFRRASPVGIRNDNGQRADDPVGGNWLFFAGAELTRPLIEESVAGVVFVDTGTVERELGFSEYRASAGVGIRLLIPQLGNSPLAFDFAVPLKKEDFDKARLFTFSLDIPFN